MNNEQITALMSDLRIERLGLINYIKIKLDRDEDYHAIMDAAADIREIDVQLNLLKKLGT